MCDVDAVYFDATLSRETILAICVCAQNLCVPLIALGVSSDQAKKLQCLRPMAITAMILRPDECEQIMSDIDAADPSEVALRFNTMVFVTRGTRGAVIYNPDGDRVRVVPPGDASMTAYGEVFASGVIAALMQGQPLVEAGNAAYEMVNKIDVITSGSNGLNNMVQGLVDKAEREPLTGLLTRAGFAAAVARTSQDKGVMLLIDLDNFKSVNDSQGHETGDGVLRCVANLIGTCTRAGDLACRWGGDEFAVFLTGIDAIGAHAVASRMLEVARNAHLHEVTLSIGLASVVEGEPLPDAISRADKAMYAAKKLGKNRIACEQAAELPD
jgi:diguanylate cyclase (GGDEF)-like protein